MKDVHRRLLFEMMANSRRSDRELAKALHISQPTVTRVRRWLESNGYIAEYTLIPDFNKIGFELAAYTFFKTHRDLLSHDGDQFQKNMTDFLEKHPNVIRARTGEGLGCDGILISYHLNFSDFARFARQLKQASLGIDVVGTFLATLSNEGQFRSLTFRHLKDYVSKTTLE